MSEPVRDETPPEWLTQSFIEKGLKKGLGNQELRILKSEIKMATSIGDNYGSIMLRVNMVVETKPGIEENRSIIIKAAPTGLIREELRRGRGDEKEEEALSRTLPAANELLKKAYPDHESLWATCYHYQRTPDDVIFMEDLRPLGYVLADRFKGLDLDHSLLVLRSLAKLHASTLPILEKENCPEVFLKNFWSSEELETLANMLKCAARTFSEVVLTWSDFDKGHCYSEKFSQLEKVIHKKVYDICERDETKLNLLLHGDTWVNNFLFKYDSCGKPKSMRFVDFQLMNLNTPALDLHHFIFTSVEPKLKFDLEALDLFLKTYHDTFQETLNRLQYHLKEPYTLDRLRKDFEEKMFWGFVTFFTFYPVVVMPKEDAFSGDDFFDENKSSSLEKAYKRKVLEDVLKKGFQFFEEKGVF